MADTIFDIVTADNLRGYYEEATEGAVQPLGQILFPRVKQMGLELNFIKGKGGVPVTLKPAAFDTRAPLRDRIGLEEIKTDMPFFKEAMLIREKDRQQLLQVLQTGNQEYINMVTERIFNDEKSLVDGAVSQEERLRMQLLTQGKIAVTANGVNLEYDYGTPEENKLTAATPWTDATAKVGQEILGWIMEARASGINVTRALTNSSTVIKLMDNDQIAKEIGGGNGNIVSPSLISQWFASKLGIELIVYDAVYQDEAGQVNKYVPDGVFTLLPDGQLGETVFGTTPEEADLMGGATDAQVSIVNTGMAITTTKTTDPVNVETKVSMINLPSFEQADKILIADIDGGGLEG